jgi:beta-glucanase (GH16 family)
MLLVKKTFFLLPFCLFGILLTCQIPTSDDIHTSQFNQLIWSDDFNGLSLDGTKWVHQLGDGSNYYPYQSGWGNGELQWYEADNTAVENGNLVIGAKYEGMKYTSSRIVTKDLFEFTYGRIAARIKLPYGDQGLWPCFWLMGSNVDQAGWPACGEVDIMEMGGRDPDTVRCTVHYGEPYNSHVWKTRSHFIDDRDYHIYQLEWDSTSIDSYIDDEHYFTFNNTGNPYFNHAFYITLNIAIGGRYDYSGNPVSANYAGEGIKMYVDWVKVYQ